MESITRCSSPLGELLLSARGDALTGLWFSGQRYYASTLFEDCREEELPVFREAEAWLHRYFAGENPGPTPPLCPRGTAFQRRVWAELQRIPYGKTISYGELAQCLDLPRGARAVGCAVGRNPISLLIPCHRVVGAKGQFTGYAGGLWRKEALLALERQAGINKTVTESI